MGLVRENLYNFHKTGDIKSSLGIGAYKIIEEGLEKLRNYPEIGSIGIENNILSIFYPVIRGRYDQIKEIIEKTIGFDFIEINKGFRKIKTFGGVQGKNKQFPSSYYKVPIKSEYIDIFSKILSN